MFSQPEEATRRKLSAGRGLPCWVALALLIGLTSGVSGDTFPPDWTGVCSPSPGPPACHFDPVAWPASDGDGLLDLGDWTPYTSLKAGIEDQGVQDPSNGGTSPQNYVNISSGCPVDLALPSIMTYYDSASQVLMFRWRVEQVANNYATGPTTQPASAVDPWNSALWTVLIDIDGDGFREYAVHVDGSSGTPSEDIDRMFVIYSDAADQSIDYLDPERTDICLVTHNPTAFTEPPGGAFPSLDGYILNFHNNLTPDPFWPNGANEDVWDYGTTRARLLEKTGCGDEYFIDYQIPLTALDAAGLDEDGTCPADAPAVTESTPICLLFTTSNSLNNPLQKDVVLDETQEFCGDPNEPAPFGDCFTLGSGGGGSLSVIEQPVIPEVTAVGCNTTALTATVIDTVLAGATCADPLASTIKQVEFFYYVDTNDNGLPDDPDNDPSRWTSIGLGTLVAGTTDQWQIPAWDSTVLRRGSYLIGVQATDDGANNFPDPIPDPPADPTADNIDHVTFSYITGLTGVGDPQEFSNPNPSPGQVFDTFNNVCGFVPSVTKAASSSIVAVGGTVTFTITVTAAPDQALLLDQIDDFLPPGWTYRSAPAEGGTLAPSIVSRPTDGASSTVSWTFGGLSIPAGTSADLTFTAQAPPDLSSGSTFVNSAEAQSANEGTLESNPVQVSLTGPDLNIAKTPDVLTTTPGSPVTFTITYGNDSAVSTTGTTITDVLPNGLTVDVSSISDGGTYDAATRTITWTIGTLAAGDSGLTVTFSADVDDPYPGANPLVNPATISATGPAPVSDSAEASVFISLPLRVQKTAASPTVAEGGNVTFTVNFENTGAVTATGATIIDTLPAGFTYVGGSSLIDNPPVNPGDPTIVGQTLTWSAAQVRGDGDAIGTVTAGNSGTLTFQATAANPFGDPNPGTNDVEFAATGLSPVSDTYDVAVTGIVCTIPTTYYMRRITANVGDDGTLEIANTTAPGNPTEVVTATFDVGGDTGGANPPTVTEDELVRFYLETPFATDISFNQDITATFYIDKSGSPQADFILSLYDYDPSTTTPSPLLTSTVIPPPTLLGSNTVGVGGNQTNTGVDFTIPQPLVTVAAGHRLLWVLTADNGNNSQENLVAVHYDGTGSLSLSDVCFVVAEPLTSINVSVDKLSAIPGDTLTYTIDFSSFGGVNATGATIEDFLPAGVTYVPGTSFLNGALTADPVPGPNGGQLWNVNGAGDGAGVISVSNSGTLTFQVTVDNAPVTATSSTLVDSATLSSSAPDVSDDAVTNLSRPNIVVTKAVDKTLLRPLPGDDTVVYTVTMTNTGDAAAANPVMDDTLPVQGYFLYVAASCAVDTTAAPSTAVAACDDTTFFPTLRVTADTLAPGETIVVTFSMQVQTAPPPPPGISTHDNFATVTNATEPGTTATSNTVTVSISTDPNLDITIVADKATVNGNEVITYTIVVENIGLGDAFDVDVTNPIPDLTTYLANSLTFEGGARTDAQDGDNAFLDLLDNELVWDLGTLLSGDTRTMTFQVTTDPTFPAGTTSIDDTATTSASNAASKQDSVSVTTPVPVLTVNKSAPVTMASPLTTLSGNHNNTTTVNVNDATLLSRFDYIHVDGDVTTQILSISGNTLTVSVAISGNNGTDVTPVIPYVIQYSNTSDTAATNVTITDPLPANTIFVNADSGGTFDGTDVIWNVGTVEAGAGGNVKFWARPTTTGSFTNTATLDSAETSPVNDTADTEIGVLTVTKSTSTPGPITSDPSDPKVIASYTVTVTNDSGLAADDLDVTDTLPTGFLFCDSTSTDVAGACSDPGYTGGGGAPPVVPGDGDAVLVWEGFNLAAGATMTIDFDVKIGLDVGAGTYNNPVTVVDTGSNLVPALPFDELLTTAEDVTIDLTAANYVLVRDFSASLADGGGVEVSWETDAELATVIFRVLRLDPGTGYVPVREVPAALSPTGASYRLLDPEAPAGGPLLYLLQEVMGNGVHKHYGPFLVDPLAPAAAAGGRERLADGFAAAPRKAEPRAKPAAPGLVGTDRGPGTGLRIGVREEGLYRVSAEAIDEALGLKPGEASSRIRSGKLLLLNDDVEVPWATEGGGHATGLLFHGQGIRSRYSNERVYRLLPSRGERMKNASGGVRGAISAAAAFTDTVRFEKDLRPALLGAYTDDTEFWLWNFYLAGDPVWGRHTLAFDAPGVVAADADAALTVAVQGASFSRGGSHHVAAYVNGVAVGDGRFGDYQTAAFTFTLPASLLQAAGNTLELVGLLDPGVTLSVFALDHFELTYERDFVATTPAFVFGSEAHEQLVVDGFADAEILLLDVTDPADPRAVQGTEVEPGTAGAYQVRFSPDAAHGRYLATVAAGVREPSSIEVDHPSSLRDASNWADYLVITAGELFTTAEGLAAHREAQGLAAMVVDVDDVMDEWNGGQLDPAAIRTFLAYTTTHWRQAPRYVALVGEGTVDYKGAWGLRANLLPPLLVAAPWGLYASDNRLADVDDDGLPDFAVGRIPAATAAELLGVIAKIVDYETMPDAAWMNDVVLVADDPDATGDYTLSSDLLATSLPAGAVAHRIYLEHQSPASAAADLRGRIESGTPLVSFLGHAGVTQLTHEKILTSADVAAFTNGGRLGVFSALSCNLGNFALPSFPSLAEELVLHPDGGAAAVWTAVGLSYNPRRVVVGEAFLRSISQGGAEVLGDAVLDALVAAASHPGVGRQTLESQVLIGDPALRLRIVPTP